MGRIAGYFNAGNMDIDPAPIFREMEKRDSYDAFIYTEDEILSFSSGSEIPVLPDDASMITFFDPSTAHATIKSDLSTFTNDIITVCDVDLFEWKGLCDSYRPDVFGTISNDAEFVGLFLRDIFKKTTAEGSNVPETLAFLDSSLRKLRGVYAFSCKANDRVYLARDLIGVKPLWYDVSNGLVFASEKKFLEKAGYSEVKELSPRQILCYNLKDNKITMHDREFLSGISEV